MHCSDEMESNLFMLTVAKFDNNRALHDLLLEAQKIWIAIYPPARRHQTPRVDKGIPHMHRRNCKKGGVPEFRKKHKTSVNQLMNNMATTSGDAVAQAYVSSDAKRSTWTPRHEAELQFLRKKAHKRKLESLPLNELLPTEITDDLKHEEVDARRVQKRMDRARKVRLVKQCQ